MIINFPETRKYWVDLQWGIVSFHGERDPLYLTLVGNPSTDGVSIKILVWRDLKPHLQLL